MTDPHIRIVGTITDMDGQQLAVGVNYDTVVIGPEAFPGFTWQLTSIMAEDFARLFTAACWEAAAQSAALAQRAELKAAAEEICLADCGNRTHDPACHGTAPAQRTSAT